MASSRIDAKKASSKESRTHELGQGGDASSLTLGYFCMRLVLSMTTTSCLFFYDHLIFSDHRYAAQMHGKDNLTTSYCGKNIRTEKISLSTAMKGDNGENIGDFDGKQR
jgi:hypothetical protein